MSMNFDRNRTQKEFELLVGINSIDELASKKDDFISYELKYTDLPLLSQCLRDDAIDYFYNGLVSFCEGIDSAVNYRFSWATIKLYYSVYYMLRSSLAIKGRAILQNKSVFLLKLAEGEIPQKKRSTSTIKYSNTHEATINHHISISSENDYLLSNEIDGNNTYHWMKSLREIVNYRCVSFQEPSYLACWHKFAEANKLGSLSSLFNKIEATPDIYCFQEDYAIVSIPFKRTLLTLDELRRKGFCNCLHDVRKQHITVIFPEVLSQVDSLTNYP